jgi:hypothetical protein
MLRSRLKREYFDHCVWGVIVGGVGIWLSAVKVGLILSSSLAWFTNRTTLESYQVKHDNSRHRALLLVKDDGSNSSLIWRSSTKWYTVNSIWKHSVLAYPKRERYYISRLCFEIARKFSLSTELYWQCDLARHFKTELNETVAFSCGISENTVFKWYWPMSSERDSFAKGIFPLLQRDFYFINCC